MNQRTTGERLSAAVLAIEDELFWDALDALDTATRVEAEAAELGDELLVQRARLCRINAMMRTGDLAGAARGIWGVHRWAVDHDATELRARSHFVWANIHRLLGDAAQCLEHSVLSVELLDDDATPFMHIWHRAKLADALGAMGSMDAAREKYAQTEALCHRLGQPVLLVMTLNNHAYTEFLVGVPARAHALTRRMRALAAEHDIELHPSVLDTIGSIQIENGQYAEAEQTLLECIRRYDDGRFEDADSMAEYLLTLTRAQRCLGAVDRAQASLDASRRECQEHDLGEVMVRVHQEQAELHAARGEFAEAYEMHKIFFTAHVALGSTESAAQARTRQAMYETTEARQEAERFREQARRDPLTGLRNRRYVDETLPALLAADPRLTVAIVDLDHFKEINDQLSHDVGDHVLTQVARLLETELAAALPDGFVARMGGEEFLVVLPGTPAPAAARVLDRIRRTVRAHAWDLSLPVTISAGLASVSDAAAPTQASLLSAADRNLYAAKHGGRDQVVYLPHAGASAA